MRAVSACWQKAAWLSSLSAGVFFPGCRESQHGDGGMMRLTVPEHSLPPESGSPAVRFHRNASSPRPSMLHGINYRQETAMPAHVLKGCAAIPARTQSPPTRPPTRSVGPWPALRIARYHRRVPQREGASRRYRTHETVIAKAEPGTAADGRVIGRGFKSWRHHRSASRALHVVLLLALARKAEPSKICFLGMVAPRGKAHTLTVSGQPIIFPAASIPRRTPREHSASGPGRGPIK